MLDASHDAAKTFTMHLQGGVELPVVRGVELSVRAGQSVVLVGPSGAGKSSILKMIFGNYRSDEGASVSTAARSSISPTPSRAQILGVRRADHRLCQPVPARGAARSDPRRRRRAADRERRRRAPRRASRPRAAASAQHSRAALGAAASTFSGGEQQRVNIARGFISDHPILLLDEPTASLDAKNRAVVVELIDEKKRARRCHGRDRA